MESIGRSLIFAGAVLVVVGLLLYANPSIPFLGKLPGDVRIERPGFRIYLPVTSCILISLAVSAALWLLSKMR
jgi:hypothetical protein